MKPGDVVKCQEHDNTMTINEIKGNTVVCDHFIGAELIRKEYDVTELTPSPSRYQ